MQGIIASLIIGALAGWLASAIMDTKGGLIKNIILGLIGGSVGNFVLGLVGITGSGWVGTILVAVVGACILIAIGRILFK